MFVLVGNSFAQTDLLSRVPELQATARKANRGGFGDKSDFSSVFPGKVSISDLLVLLEARVEANNTDEKNFMSGEVSDLVYVILSGLPDFKEAKMIPVVKELLKDKDDVIRRWSVIALLRLAEKSEALQHEIEKIVFPQAAIKSARDEKLPAWISIEINDQQIDGCKSEITTLYQSKCSFNFDIFEINK